MGLRFLKGANLLWVKVLRNTIFGESLILGVRNFEWSNFSVAKKFGVSNSVEGLIF